MLDTPVRRSFGALSKALAMWMLAVMLETHAGEEMAFVDRMRRPELAPFRLGVTVDELQQHRWFALQRQGMGIEMVQLNYEYSHIAQSAPIAR